MTSALPFVALAALVTLFMLGSYGYFRSIRNGRIDPRNDPEWGPYRAPASPHSLRDMDTRFGPRPEIDDDHIRYIDE